MKPGPTLQYRPGLHYSVDLRTQTYTESVPLKCGKLATKYPWIYGHFLQQCTHAKAIAAAGVSTVSITTSVFFYMPDLYKLNKLMKQTNFEAH